MGYTEKRDSQYPDDRPEQRHDIPQMDPRGLKKPQKELNKKWKGKINNAKQGTPHLPTLDIDENSLPAVRQTK